jgi:ABC-type multidrug transport system ATPase subunit/peptidoglycan/LPS O-acetylase OafA/YrhL
MNSPDSSRLHSLDAVRGFALLLGVAFHAALSFMPGWPPGIWAMNDSSPSAFLSDAAFVTHVFRMSLFFFIAGFFARLMHQRLGTGGFWGNRVKRILLPLILGWLVMAPLLTWIWNWGLGIQLGGTPPAFPMPEDFFPLTHLWFLYVLMILYAATMAVRAVVDRLDRAQQLRNFIDQLVSASLRWHVAVFTLGIPLAAALMALPMWFYWQGIPTPDMSLLPNTPALVGFGSAFAFGWLVHRARDGLAAISTRWYVHLAIGMLATAWLLHIVHTVGMAQPDRTRNLYACVFGVAVWGWVLGLTGAALRFLSNYSAIRRYIADASYWVYLAHLPVVAALQVWLGKWELHWGVKYPLILVVSFAVLFASYELLVRHTFLGQWLNGRKYPRGRRPGNDPSGNAPSPTTPPSSPPPRGPISEGTVAELRGITKKFGAVTALDGIDIQVRGGELLAVLGPNGAGKSTAISLWLGLTEADAGNVTLLGGSPRDVARRQGLGVMMQDVELPKELRVRELVTLASSYYSDPLPVDETLRRAGVLGIADKPYGRLSGGQKRLAQFAVAICGQPRVLFLDEPSVGLDVKAREALWNSVRALLASGCSIVLTTHYLEEAEALATRVAVIGKGRVIASGTVDDMRALVARRQISCESRLSPDEIRGWPGVIDARRDRDRLLVTASDAEGVVRRMLAADATLNRLEVRQAGLNEAFTELTREAA